MGLKAHVAVEPKTSNRSFNSQTHQGSFKGFTHRDIARCMTKTMFKVMDFFRQIFLEHRNSTNWKSSISECTVACARSNAQGYVFLLLMQEILHHLGALKYCNS